MILVANPLHYKRIVAKKRLHTLCFLTFIGCVTDNTCYFIFFRQDRFIMVKECVMSYVLQAIPMLIKIVTLQIIGMTMLINFIILTVKLRKMRAVALGSKIGTQENDHKLIQASWMTLSLFLIFILPTSVGGVIVIFLGQPYPTHFNIYLDLGYILDYMNNIFNPFVYYKFLKDFRKGYRAMLCCESNGSGTRNTANNSCSLRTLSSSVQTASTQYN